MTPRAHRAERHAREIAASRGVATERDGRRRPRRFAVGDPQAPLSKFLEILDANGLLGDDGRLAPDVELTSMGDHFDWGPPHEVDRAAEDGLALLAWLASHPPDQVRLVAGNHDLGRVGELAAFDDVRFADAHRDARRVYPDNPSQEPHFLRRWPELPTAELAARDFSTFRESQRGLVVELLRARRMRVAYAEGEDRLLLHAGVTLDHVGGLRSAPEIARALNDALDRALTAWRPGTPLALPGLHRPGDALRGEGDGIFYHRPAAVVRNARKFDPRRLPAGLTQIIGHISDKKCRELMPDWHDGAAAAPGVLRSLVTDGTSVHYAHGVRERGPAEALVIFTDGAMHSCPPSEYQLLPLA